MANPPEAAKDYPERLCRLIGYDYGRPYLGFHNVDDPHRIFELGYEGPRQRTRPEIDRAYEKVGLIKFGEVEATLTPEREEAKVSSPMCVLKND